MDDVHILPNDYGTEVGKKVKEIGQSGGGGDRRIRKIVDLQTWKKVSNPDSIWRMAMGYDNHLCDHSRVITSVEQEITQTL